MRKGRPPASPILAMRERRDAPYENILRPGSLGEYVGQVRAKRVLSTALRAATKRGECLDHVLVHGNPGFGKTTLAMILAGEMGARLRVTSGAALARGADVLATLNELKRGDLLFIDEVHRLKKPVEELLYPALEDFRIDVAVGKGPTARIMRLPVQPFTLVGATTKLGSLSAPFRNRFGFVVRLEPYAEEDLVAILERSAATLGCRLEPGAAHELARRARGTPRIANHLLKRARDYAQTSNAPAVDRETVAAALEDVGVDADGLDAMDRRLLDLLVNRYRGAAVGLKTLAIAAGEDAETVEGFYEPYLIQAGFLVRTAQGRRATPLAARRFRASGGAP